MGIQNSSRDLSSLIKDIKDGKIKIPQFQRDFVWSKKDSSELLDSIVKKYPIGTLILWKTKDRLRSIKNIGNINLPEPEVGDYVQFVLDGQQRITSIFAALRGEIIERAEGKKEDFSEIYVDLEAGVDDKIIIMEISDRNSDEIIKLNTLLEGGLRTLTKYSEKYHEKLEEYKRKIESYPCSITEVHDCHIDKATEIFTRINVGGKTLTIFQIMVAKTFDEERNFVLGEKFDELIKELKDVEYETIPGITILQTISIILKKECQRKIILTLDKEDIIKYWPSIIDSIKMAIDYFKKNYRIPASRLLPYNALIIPFAYFFYHHKENPTEKKQKYLEDFFWRVSLSGRYSSATETKLAQDIKRIDKILNDELPEYDWSINTSIEHIIEQGGFSVERSYVKAILCIYTHQQPKSFIYNSLVTVDNDWLKRSNSKNYHHFFPKAFLKKKGLEDYKINHILNITIVDDYLNKRIIRDKPPSQYMKEFKEKNDRIEETMKTHLIDDLDKFGIWDDDYETFMNMRAKAVSEEIKKRLISQSKSML